MKEVNLFEDFFFLRVASFNSEKLFEQFIVFILNMSSERTQNISLTILTLPQSLLASLFLFLRYHGISHACIGCYKFFHIRFTIYGIKTHKRVKVKRLFIRASLFISGHIFQFVLYVNQEVTSKVTLWSGHVTLRGTELRDKMWN